MSRIQLLSRGSLLALAGWLLFAGPTYGQSINGRVLDAQRNPVPGIEVLFHAVTESSGSEIDRDTTDAAGAFQVAGTGTANAIYFVAVRYQGELYMGEMMRPPFPTDQEYVVQVGLNAVRLSPDEGAGPPAPTATIEDRKSRTAGLLVILAATAVIGLILFLALRNRAPSHRRWLVELARVEDELAANSGPSDVLQQRREQLRRRLLATGRA